VIKLDRLPGMTGKSAGNLGVPARAAGGPSTPGAHGWLPGAAAGHALLAFEPGTRGS